MSRKCQKATSMLPISWGSFGPSHSFCFALPSTMLREFSPRSFRGPPNDHASTTTEHRQRKPCIEVNRYDTGSEHEQLVQSSRDSRGPCNGNESDRSALN